MIVGQALEAGWVVQRLGKGLGFQSGDLGGCPEGFRFGQRQTLLVPGPKQGEVIALVSVLALPSGRLGGPKGAQRGGIGPLGPIGIDQGLFPDPPVPIPLVVDLVEGEGAPADRPEAGPPDLDPVEPLRGSEYVGSHIVAEYIQDGHKPILATIRRCDRQIPERWSPRT